MGREGWQQMLLVDYQGRLMGCTQLATIKHRGQGVQLISGTRDNCKQVCLFLEEGEGRGTLPPTRRALGV